MWSTQTLIRPLSLVLVVLANASFTFASEEPKPSRFVKAPVQWGGLTTVVIDTDSEAYFDVASQGQEPSVEVAAEDDGVSCTFRVHPHQITSRASGFYRILTDFMGPRDRSCTFVVTQPSLEVATIQVVYK